ncbi:MAG: EAL domain-containing protein [Betaproteobacteria bacterium]
MVTAATYESLMQFLYQAPIGLVQTTLAGDIEMMNPTTARLLMPLSRDGGLDNLFTALENVAPRLRHMAAAVDQPSGVVCDSLRIPLPATGGSAGSVVLSISMLKLDEARLVAVINDVTLEVQREQEGLSRTLGVAERVDKLTGLPNRFAVLERLQASMKLAAKEPGHEFALLYMNGDRFKQINDSLGYAVGDKLLSLIAERLRSTLRSRPRDGPGTLGGPLIARIGGDEFAVLLDDLKPPNNVYGVAQRLVDQLAKPYTIGTHELFCSVSMGVVLRDTASADADAVLQDASLAMAEAKRAGGMRFVLFEPGMHSRATHRASLEVDLRLALTDDQLFVVYQPVVGLQGKQSAEGIVERSAGVEALVRWQHPLRGVVPPFEFISVAEECGLIDALGEFVLRTACRQFVQWQAQLGARAPRTLAVNLSRGQLGEPGLISIVDGILRSSGMPPAQLQLEVTESLAAQGESALAKLRELKALGLTLALDDFGTGYSSLSSLHQIPVDTVKIDRSFVSKADTSLHHRVLIEATIHVAHSLGMNTVAEGIETQAQADVVRQLGADKGQGYLFSKPLLSADLVKWLEIEK